ncbi:MAG: hypothetical protein COA96_08025 [SAR86 cluster bacterium]|uniref:Uncharacterized protein n=1 Tax=SAR86 cluster bacterium TaxID=2030880 RepID=A0A2A5B0Q8_9GAMM|nr:MAG: hypothetical protein COA96_08025 [SAR86 cluster bacterium]
MLNGHVRIGSLLYYRKIEEESRNDRNEGFRSYFIEGKKDVGRKIEAGEFNKVAALAGSNIRFNTDRPNPLALQMRGGGKFTFDSDINLFVFCATIEDEPNPSLNKKFGAHKIHVFDPDRFKDLVRNELLNLILHKRSIKLPGKADSISATHHEVLYRDKPAVNVDDVREDLEHPALNTDDVFIKPQNEGFEEECEYRFCWIPSDNPTGTMCNLPTGFKFIDLEIPDIKSAIRKI